MKPVINAICIILMCWLVSVPAEAAVQTKSAAQSSAKAKAQVGAKAKARAKAKASARAKSKATATKPARSASPAPALRQDPADESSFDAEVDAASRILSRKPGDGDAADRLARASVILIDGILDAEAVGDAAKVRRLTQKLDKYLRNTGGRVQKMAQKGDLRARQAVGFLLGRGIVLERDAGRSCGEYLVAAEKLAPAGWHTAQCLMELAPDKAWEQMERAAQRGHAGAQEWMGRRCLGEFGATEKDFVCARSYLVQSASQGRSRAQTLFAYLLATGQGGAVDVPRAIRLYNVAAEQGDVNAQNNLGEIHETGRGVPKSPDQAILWYERAAAQGMGSAQFNAGRLWAIGVGEKKDPARARAFLVQAEGNGVPQARQVLDWLDRQGVRQFDEAPAARPANTQDGNTAKD